MPADFGNMSGRQNLTDWVSKIRPNAKAINFCRDTVATGALAESFFKAHCLLLLGINRLDDLNYLSQPSAQQLNKFSLF